jgi:hypothetical protein
MKYFIFVVFEDPEVVGILDFLAEALSGKVGRGAPHLTVQGPFGIRPTSAQIASIKRRLASDEFLIANPGIFETPAGVALYLSVRSDNLRKVWRKPDFPVEKYGFNPHLTLYEGGDVDRAKRAFNFLRAGRHRIELICRDFDVVPYAAKQKELFPMEGAEADEHAVTRLIARGKVSSSFRAAFLRAVNSHE